MQHSSNANNRIFTFLVIVMESRLVSQTIYRVSGETVTPHSAPPQRWDCSAYADDRTGKRLIEEVLRRMRSFLGAVKVVPDAVAITLPGTIESNSTITRSVRLGIYERIDVSAMFQQQHAPPCFVFHDTECLAIGEAVHGALKSISTGSGNAHNFAYILVDEGIGSTVYINGIPLKGNGSAGHLGRLIFMPTGLYHQAFSSRGSLEVLAARPWVSASMVQKYLSLKGKWEQDSNIDQTFRSMLQTASENEKDWSALSYAIMAAGLVARDPIAVTVLDQAAFYLGMAINCIIGIVNPPAIVVGGGMIDSLPGIYDSVVEYAREFSWVTAWNRTTVRAAVLGREAQVYGAVEMLKPLMPSR